MDKDLEVVFKDSINIIKESIINDFDIKCTYISNVLIIPVRLKSILANDDYLEFCSNDKLYFRIDKSNIIGIVSFKDNDKNIYNSFEYHLDSNAIIEVNITQ